MHKMQKLGNFAILVILDFCEICRFLRLLQWSLQ